MARADTTSVYLDPAEAAAAQRVRRHKFHTEDVPRLRLIGFAFNAVGVVVHLARLDTNRLVATLTQAAASISKELDESR